MKKLMILLVAAFMVMGLNAQNAKRTSAYNYLKNGKLDKAQEYIDPCITHPKTMNVAKTWYYRGDIYLQIGLSSNAEYQALDPDPFGVAYESYKKVLELDSRGEYTNSVQHNFKVIASQYFNNGVKKYNEEDFDAAAFNFQRCYDISGDIGVTDTLALSNVAIAYDVAGEPENALPKYKELVELGYNDPSVYNSLATIYLNQGDTVSSEEYVMMGREKFPEDHTLLIAETNIYLARGESEKAIRNLQKARDVDPTNKTIWFALGTNYEKIGDIESAEKAYLKCIEIDPAYADAYYNLGVMFNNQADEIYDVANELPLDAVEEYNTEKAKADALLAKALPYLEKSDELNPDDLNILSALKTIYTILKDMDKLQEVNARIKALTQ